MRTNRANLSVGRRAAAIGVACAAGLTMAACGDDEDFENEPRPPAPINVTAAVTQSEVVVSPRRFGAGPVVFILTNQSDSAQNVVLQSEEGGAGTGIQQDVGPIQPRGTATLKVDVPRGAYRLRTDDRSIDAADIAVGAKRRSSQDELLLP